MKKRNMLQKANKILAAVMTASMLTSTIVPGTAVYASEISAPEEETEDGFTDGMEEETPVVTQNQEEETPEFDDGSVEVAGTGISSSSVEVSSADELRTAVNDKNVNSIKLKNDIKISFKMTISHNLTIDLAGYTITETDNNVIFEISSGTEVTLTSSSSKKGVLTGGKSSDGRGGAVLNYGTTTIEKINITGNSADAGGGIGNFGGTLIIKNADIAGNKATSGGGIFSNEGNLTLENVGITGNEATNGGGICSYDTSLKLTNVWIEENEGKGDSALGAGGVGGLLYEIDDDNQTYEAVLDEVTIQNNKSKEMPNVYIDLGSKESSFTLKNKITIKENIDSSDDTFWNLYLYSETSPKKSISIDSEVGLSTDSEIGIYAYQPSDEGDIIVKNFKEEYINCFHIDYPSYERIGFKGEGKNNLYVFNVVDVADEVKGNVCEYDGKDHQPEVIPGGEGETVEYKKSTDDDSAYASEAPKYKDAGEYTVDYRIKKDNEIERSGQLTVKISPKKVIVSGIKVNDKQYDGTVHADFNYDEVTLEGKLPDDQLNVKVTGAFETAVAETTLKTVNLTDISFTGADAKNYTLDRENLQGSLSAHIWQKTITVSIKSNGGTYGMVKPAEAVFQGIVEGENVRPSILYSDDVANETEEGWSENVPENAGVYKVKVMNNDASNYLLTGNNTAEFRIEPKSLTRDMVNVSVNADGEFLVMVKDDTGADSSITLEENKDYKVKAVEENGIATITTEGIGNYTGIVIKKITAVKKSETGTGSVVTTVTTDDSVKDMNPYLEPVSEEQTKEVLIKDLTDKNADDEIINVVNGKTDGTYDATFDLVMKELKEEDITPTVADEIKKIEELIKKGEGLPSSASIGKKLDLKFYLNYQVKGADGSLKYKGNQLITDTGDWKERVTVDITNDLKTTAANTTRTYYVVCVHNGVAHVVPSTVIGDRISFTATQYSTYAIVYKDTYYAPSYPVTGIKVSTDKVNLTKKGETAQVKVEVTPSYADNKNLTWKSSDEKVATVDKDGKITAVGNGTATITVTSVSGNYTATITVTVNDESEVKPVEIEKITIDTEAKALTKIGESVELKVKVEPENADSSKLTWKSSDEKVAVVDKDGKVTAVGNGTATITVTTEDGKHTASVTITVKAADEPTVNKTTSYGNLKARSVKQTNTSVTLEWTRVSGADGYLIYGNRCNGNGKTYKYQKLATITNGKTRTWTQTGLKKGTYYKYIVKAYKLVDGKKVVTDTSVSVHAVTRGGKYGVAKAVSVTKIGSKKNTLKVTLKSGKTAQITAKEVKMDKAIRHHRNICYESSNTKVATVTSDGLIQATGKGTCSIWVYAQNGVYKTITVTVK